MVVGNSLCSARTPRNQDWFGASQENRGTVLGGSGDLVSRLIMGIIGLLYGL